MVNRAVLLGDRRKRILRQGSPPRIGGGGRTDAKGASVVGGSVGGGVVGSWILGGDLVFPTNAAHIKNLVKGSSQPETARTQEKDWNGWEREIPLRARCSIGGRRKGGYMGGTVDRFGLSVPGEQGKGADGGRTFFRRERRGEWGICALGGRRDHKHDLGASRIEFVKGGGDDRA